MGRSFYVVMTSAEVSRHRRHREYVPVVKCLVSGSWITQELGSKGICSPSRYL